MTEQRPTNFNDLRPRIEHNRVQHNRVEHTSATVNTANTYKKRIPEINWDLKKLVIVLVVIIMSLLTYGYLHTKSQLDRLSNPQTASKDATQQILDKVGKNLQLPTGETPLLVSVNDAKKAQNQGSLFTLAQNGDKLLYYQKSGYVLLYRPSTNKVIEFSKVNTNGS